MSEKELLDDFLRHSPESFHPFDEKRFVRWAVVAHHNHSDFPRQSFLDAHMKEKTVDYYLNAFRFVGYTLEVLDE